MLLRLEKVLGKEKNIYAGKRVNRTFTEPYVRGGSHHAVKKWDFVRCVTEKGY